MNTPYTDAIIQAQAEDLIKLRNEVRILRSTIGSLIPLVEAVGKFLHTSDSLTKSRFGAWSEPWRAHMLALVDSLKEAENGVKILFDKHMG